MNYHHPFCATLRDSVRERADMGVFDDEVWQTGPMQPGPTASSAVGSSRPAPMLARQRQEHILERVAATGGVRVADIVEELGISEMTVRRDITELVTQGLV